MSLPELWFILIGVLWTLYLTLEGFDFGVGILVPVLSRSEGDRQAMFGSIAPVWDGNEVWLVIAAGATFAAFPPWYATLFSGFYFALFLILLLLIVRAVSFEWRGKVEGTKWRGLWTWLNFAGSLGTPALWGLLLATLLHGVPMSSAMNYRGSIADLLSLYSALGAVALVLLCVLHGAEYVALRTEGGLSERAKTLGARLSPTVSVLGVAFLAWTVLVGAQQGEKALWSVIPAALGAIALLGAAVFNQRARIAGAFVSSVVAIAALVATLFVALYPRLIVASTNAAYSLTVENSSSAHYTLTVMTVATAILLPVIVLYQLWSYRVFRARIERRGIESPADVMFPKPRERPQVE